jgi:hypothetical protein
MLLIDPKPISFIITPDNGIPAVEYNPDYDSGNNEDGYLLSLKDEIMEIRRQVVEDKKDVRDILNTEYQVRKTLKNAKLI